MIVFGVLCLALLALQVVDIYTTSVAVSRFGPAIESNPIARWLFENSPLGTHVTTALKLIIPFIIFISAMRDPHIALLDWILLVFITFFYAFATYCDYNLCRNIWAVEKEHNVRINTEDFEWHLEGEEMIISKK